MPAILEQPGDYQIGEFAELVEVRNWVVLVVDDEPGVRDLCCTVLQRAGLSTVSACDGKEALGLCRDCNGAIDLLPTDVNLREGPNGVEFGGCHPETVEAHRRFDYAGCARLSGVGRGERTLVSRQAIRAGDLDPGSFGRSPAGDAFLLVYLARGEGIP